MSIKILTNLRKRMGEQSENFNKEIENIIKYQTNVAELKNIVIELENTLGIQPAHWTKQRNRSRSYKIKQWNSPRQSNNKKESLKK